MAFRCDQCGNCCLRHRVPLTQSDVGRLTRAGHEPQDFIEFLRPDEIDLTGEPETLAELPGGPRLAVLAHVGKDGCRFLSRGRAGPRRCTVHADRPAACRAYPFDRGERTGRAFDLHPDADCPKSTGVLSVIADQAPMSVMHQIRDRDHELFSHAEFVQKWNRAQRLRRKLGKRRKTVTDLLSALVGSRA